MTEQEFLKFRKAELCSDSELLELTEEQMNAIANTDLRVKSGQLDRELAYAKRKNLEKPATRRNWKPEPEDIE